jgi:hypothetical protein
MGVKQMMACIQGTLISWMDAHHTKTEANHEELMAAMKASHVRIKDPTDVSLEKTEAKPEETEFGVQHEVPKEDAANGNWQALKKWHGIWNLAKGHRKKPKEWPQGKGGCQKLAAACRGMTQRAGLAGYKGHCSQGYSRGNVAPRTRKGREETLERPGMQKWNKEPGHGQG